MFKSIYIYHYLVVLIAQIPWTFSCHPSLSVITLGSLSRLYPVSAQRCCTFMLVGQLCFVYRWLSLMRSCLFVLLRWFVRWEVRGCTVVVSWIVASRICSKRLADSTSICKCVFFDWIMFVYESLSVNALLLFSSACAYDPARMFPPISWWAAVDMCRLTWAQDIFHITFDVITASLHVVRCIILLSLPPPHPPSLSYFRILSLICNKRQQSGSNPQFTHR